MKNIIVEFISSGSGTPTAVSYGDLAELAAFDSEEFHNSYPHGWVRAVIYSNPKFEGKEIVYFDESLNVGLL